MAFENLVQNVITHLAGTLTYIEDNSGIATLILAVVTVISIRQAHKQHSDQMEQSEIDRKRASMAEIVKELESVSENIQRLDEELKPARDKEMNRFPSISNPQISTSLIQDIKGEDNDTAEKLRKLKNYSQSYNRERKNLERAVKKKIKKDLSPEDHNGIFPPCYDNVPEFRRAKQLIFDPKLSRNENVTNTIKYLNLLRSNHFSDELEFMEEGYLNYMAENTTEIKGDVEDLIDRMYQKYDILRTVDENDTSS